MRVKTSNRSSPSGNRLLQSLPARRLAAVLPRVGLLLVLAAALPAPVRAQQASAPAAGRALDVPVACRIGADCFVQNYVEGTIALTQVATRA